MRSEKGGRILRFGPNIAIRETARKPGRDVANSRVGWLLSFDLEKSWTISESRLSSPLVKAHRLDELLAQALDIGFDLSHLLGALRQAAHCAGVRLRMRGEGFLGHLERSFIQLERSFIQ